MPQTLLLLDLDILNFLATGINFLEPISRIILIHGNIDNLPLITPDASNPY